MPESLIDWDAADWLARRLAASSEHPWPTVDLQPIVDDAAGRVSAYTGLYPSAPLPPAEGIGRREWIRANMSSARLLLEPTLNHAAQQLAARRRKPKTGSERRLGLPNPPAIPSMELATSAEIGVIFGFMAKRVLGQFEFPMVATTESAPPTRLLFVLPNLGDTVVKLSADEREFVTWVALHEVTHAVQFGGVEWLRGYLAENVAFLLAAAERRLTHKGLHLPGREDLARIGHAAIKLDIYGLVAHPEERAVFDRMQTVMAVIEGHAEHVMDAVAPELIPSLPALRAGLDARRHSQSWFAKLIGRLLGLEMKMRQYEEGKSFWDAIVDARGHAALTKVFESPETLPSAEELARPALWLARTA